MQRAFDAPQNRFERIPQPNWNGITPKQMITWPISQHGQPPSLHQWPWRSTCHYSARSLKPNASQAALPEHAEVFETKVPPSTSQLDTQSLPHTWNDRSLISQSTLPTQRKKISEWERRGNSLIFNKSWVSYPNFLELRISPFFLMYVDSFWNLLTANSFHQKQIAGCCCQRRRVT